MILILRGHTRASFDEDNLYNITAQLARKYPIEIYIHTWDVQASKLSWRQVEQNNKPVTEESIRAYFRDLSPLIKHIIIDDDSQVELIGKTEGGVCLSCAPLEGMEVLLVWQVPNSRIFI